MDDLKAKTTDILDVLESTFGVERWEGGRDALETLIRTVLSQNTNDTNRDRAYGALRARFPTWEDVMNADPKDLADAIRVGGLANQKSVRIRDILRWIKARYGALDLDYVCDMPTSEVIDTLCQQKGVGIKTVSVMLMFACGRDIFPVDTHIHRISKRLGLIPATCTAEKAHQVMADLIPPGKAYSFHLNLLKFGRRICHARNPECERCPLWDVCLFEGKKPRGFN